MMRLSAKKTPQKSRELSTQRSNKSNKSVCSSLYFCHYRNAMYMGGMRTFQKHGHGILLHDSGITVLSNYHNDLMHGHNIFFANDCLASAIYAKNKISEIVYRTDGFLLSLTYNSHEVIDGKCLLLNFISQVILYVDYKKGILVDKREQRDFTVINNVFQMRNLSSLIGQKHAKVMQFQFDKMVNIGAQKQNNKLFVGFNKNGLLNGLGFNFFIGGEPNLETLRQQDQFRLKLIQRGYYINSVPNGQGEKWFKNGNLYIGQFRNGTFQGHGILKNTIKKNWVSGYFQNGNLVDLADYSNQGQQKKCQRLVSLLHERKTNWINYEIILLDPNTFDKQIRDILNIVPKNQVRTLEERKQEVLRRIQSNFIQSTTGENLILIDSKTEQESSRNFGRNFIPQSPDRSSNTDRFMFFRNKKSESPPFSSTMREGLSKSLIQFDKSKLEGTQQRSSDAKGRRSRIFPKSPQSNSQAKQILIRESREKFYPSRAYYISQRDEMKLRQKRFRDEQKRINSDPQEPLDSKRMVSRSQIYRYLNEQQTESLPQFSYAMMEGLQPGSSSRDRVKYQNR